MSEICVRINEYTDPSCPWAYSAEPFRRRLNWLYEGRIEWVPGMVVLADTAHDYAERGFTPEWMAQSQRGFVRDPRMPMDARVRPRGAGARGAGRGGVAARRHASERAT